MPSSATDSCKTSFENSSKAFSRSRNILAERDLYPLLKAVFGAAVFINIAINPLLKPREYLLIGWADHLTLTSTQFHFMFPDSDSDLIFRRTLLGYYAEGMHAKF